MLVIEDQPDAGALMQPQGVGSGEAQVVVLQHEASADVLGALLPAGDPAFAAGIMVIVHAADVRHQHGSVVQPHAVEHLGLRGQIPDRLGGQLGIGRVEQHELRRMEGQSYVVVARLAAERRQLGIALRHHIVELRHVGVGGIGREVGR